MKLLEELSVCELRTALENAGIEGSFSDTMGLVKLTMHLVSRGEDPFTFQFFGSGENVHEVEEEYDEVVLKDTLDTKSESGPSIGAGIAVSWVADGDSARCSSGVVSDPLSTFDGNPSASISVLPIFNSSIDSTRMCALQMLDDIEIEICRQVAWTPDAAYVPYHEEYGGASWFQSCFPGHH